MIIVIWFKWLWKIFLKFCESELYYFIEFPFTFFYFLDNLARFFDLLSDLFHVFFCPFVGFWLFVWGKLLVPFVWIFVYFLHQWTSLLFMKIFNRSLYDKLSVLWFVSAHHVLLIAKIWYLCVWLLSSLWAIIFIALSTKPFALISQWGAIFPLFILNVSHLNLSPIAIIL